MPDPLSAETLARIKLSHHPEPRSDCLMLGDKYCISCEIYVSDEEPCDAALLLAELERVTTLKWWEGFPSYWGSPVKLPPGYVSGDVSHYHVHPVPCSHAVGAEGDIGRALCGPSTSEELA